jgi:hypothetical protein
MMEWYQHWRRPARALAAAISFMMSRLNGVERTHQPVSGLSNRQKPS